VPLRRRLEVSDEALTPESFQTIAAIDTFVQRAQE
jgi:hypothetical protein